MELFEQLLDKHVTVVKDALTKAGAQDIGDVLSLSAEDAGELGLPLVPRKAFVRALTELKKLNAAGGSGSPWEQPNDDSEYETQPLSTPAPTQIQPALTPVYQETDPVKPKASGLPEVAPLNQTQPQLQSQSQPLQTTPQPLFVPTYSLWVGNLPATAKEETLRSFFSSFGKLHSVAVRHGPKGRQAFVNFLSETDSDNALEAVHGKELFGSDCITANKQKPRGDVSFSIETALPKIEVLKVFILSPLHQDINSDIGESAEACLRLKGCWRDCEDNEAVCPANF